MRPRPAGAQRGSAVAETVLVLPLLTLLFLGVLQLGLALHVRTVLTDAAGEGARHGGLVGRGPQDAVDRTRGLVDAATAGRYPAQVTARVDRVEGVALVVVTVRAPLPVVGLAGPAELTVTGRAVAEEGL